MMAVDNSVGLQPALGEVRKLENPFVRRLAVSVAAPPDAVLRALKSLAWNRGENAFGFQSFFFRMHCSRHYSSAVRVSGSVERRGPVCIVRAEMRLSPADIIGAWAVFLLFAPADRPSAHAAEAALLRETAGRKAQAAGAAHLGRRLALPVPQSENHFIL